MGRQWRFLRGNPSSSPPSATVRSLRVNISSIKRVSVGSGTYSRWSWGEVGRDYVGIGDSDELWWSGGEEMKSGSSTYYIVIHVYSLARSWLSLNTTQGMLDITPVMITPVHIYTLGPFLRLLHKFCGDYKYICKASIQIQIFGSQAHDTMQEWLNEILLSNFFCLVYINW